MPFRTILRLCQVSCQRYDRADQTLDYDIFGGRRCEICRIFSTFCAAGSEAVTASATKL